MVFELPCSSWRLEGSGEKWQEGIAPKPLMFCLWLKDLCVFLFLSQLGFSHSRSSSNYRWDSPGWCERVICQVPKIWLHYHPPGWHVSNPVGLVPTQDQVYVQISIEVLAWNHMDPPDGLECWPDQTSGEDITQKKVHAC